jgi:type IV pilus assembly protein PilY1
MKRGVALLLIVIVSLAALNVSPVLADDSDIFGANIQPNVMILIDSSGSMSDPVTSIPYVSSTNYAVVNLCGPNNNLACTSTVVYRRTSGDYVFYKTTVADVASASARNALNSTGFWSGSIGGSNVNLFLGNYLNYLLGVCAAAPCTEPKITVAKRAIINLIANTEGVRFGTMKFKSGGGQVIHPIGTAVGTTTTPGTLLYGVQNMTQTSVGTVTGEQIRDAGLYYEGRFGFPSPIQLECQPNFIILISDGLWNGTVDPEPQGTARFTQDHAGGASPEPVFAGLQNVIVHTVGFGIGASEPSQDVAANDVLRRTAANGGGSFFKTDTGAQLELALQEQIRQIVAATFTFASPVIPTTSTTGSTRAYLASFQSDPVRPFWRGFLKAFDRDPATGLVRLLPDGTPDPAYQAWEAGDLLRLKSSSTRTIYAVVGGSRQDFNKSNANITAALLGVSTSADRDKVIDFTRGIDAYDEDLDTNVTEERAWKLGDIFHSTPVLVTPPLSPSTDSTYVSFKSANSSRTTFLLAGANDGMIHAYRESDGEELWALIPADQLGRLKDLTARSGEHGYYLDSSPIAADIKLASGTWKTIAIFGERRGGKTYHTLDITNPTNPVLLWTFTDAKMGETWSEPAVGKVKIAGSPETEKYVAFVGGGYDTATNNASGKAFFALDLGTGEKLWEYFNNGDAAGDDQYMNFSLAANSTAADLTNDGFVDKVYVGDVGGQLWKFDVSGPATLSGGVVTNWTGKRLFAASPSQANPPAAGAYLPAQAIYGAPALAFDENANLWVYFGTGDRNHPNNAASNRFYGIKDDTSMANGSTLTESTSSSPFFAGLVDVTSANLTATQGWFFSLSPDEKVLAASDVFNKVVFFSTFTPTTVVACGTGGGTAKLYAIQMLTGYGAVDWTDGSELASSDSSNTRSKTIGTGIPSKPVLVIGYSGATVTTSVVAGTTSQQLPSNPAPAPSSLKRLLYWREVLP